MKDKYTTTIKSLLLVLIPWIILAIIFGFFDLEISKSIVDFDSPLGIFGEIWGDLPGYGLIGISASILISGHSKSIPKQKIGTLFIVIIGVIVFISGILLEYDKILFLGLCISVSSIIFSCITFKKDWRCYFTIALVIGLLALLNSLIFIHVIKVLWGRVRYFDIVVLGEAYYTPWFIPAGPSIENTSFPSGHVSMAFLFLPLLIIIREKKWKSLTKVGISSIIVAWGILISFSRILYGPHYASDVLFSAGFTALFTIVLFQFIYLKKENFEVKMNLIRNK
ncbi:MAG: phosphatase PAP2 family protein [Promethearchaeota archaeon]